MFSITTIASSTTKPVEMVSAINERFVEAVIRAGTSRRRLRSAISVPRLRESSWRAHCAKNRKTTMITSEIEMISESSTSRTEARIVVVAIHHDFEVDCRRDRRAELR